jgi:hypothetical protein
MAACDYHPEATAVGVCMRCEARICSACCTRLEGINHCHRCLAELGRRSSKKRNPNSVLAALALIAVLLSLFYLVLRMAQGTLY